MVSESCCGQLHLLQKEIIIIRNGAKTISLQYFNIGRNLICIVCFSWLQDFFILQLLYPENHRLVASHCQTLSHNVLSITPRHEQGSNSQLQWRQALIAQLPQTTTVPCVFWWEWCNQREAHYRNICIPILWMVSIHQHLDFKQYLSSYRCSLNDIRIQV